MENNEHSLDPRLLEDTPFDFSQLDPETQHLYGSEAQFNELVADWLNKQGEDERNTRFIEERLHPQFPEKPSFTQEIQDPLIEQVGDEGNTFAVYRLNRDKQGPPVIVNLSWSVGADSRSGRPFLKSLCDQVDRPIFVIDTVATGNSSIPSDEFVKKMDFEMLAKLEMEALTKAMGGTLSPEGIDIVGISMGGIRALKQAELLKDKVKSVTTIDTPGFEKKNAITFINGFLNKEAKNWEKLKEADQYNISEDTKFYAQTEFYGPTGITLNTTNLPLRWRVALGAAKPVLKMFTGGMEPEQFSADRIPTFVRFFNLMKKKNVQGIETKLSPTTRWNDVIGSDDAITDYEDHLTTVRSRNAHQITVSSTAPRASVHIIGGFNHSWTTQHTQVASTVGTLLRR